MKYRYICLDCQEKDFNGWPAQVPKEVLQEDVRSVMLGKSTKYPTAASILPALPSDSSSPPGEAVPILEVDGGEDGDKDGDKDEDEEIADRLLQAHIANDKSSDGDGSNESSDGDDELVNLDEFDIDLDDEGDTTKHPPRTFKPQELSSEVAALLEKERRAFVVPTKLDEKIQKHCFEKIGLPRTTSLPGTIKSLFNMNNENDMVLMSQVLYTHVLDEENFTDAPKYQERSNHIHRLMSAVTLARLGEDYKDCIHYGTEISSLDMFMTIMRYPTLNDKGKVHCWNRRNGCTLLHELIMPLWLSAEKARRDGTYEKGMKFFKRLASAGLDLATVNLRKGSEVELETEQEEITDHLGFVNVEQWWSLSFGYTSLHINNTVKHHDKPALVNMASRHTMLAWAGARGDFSGTYAKFYDTCHGQVPLMGTQVYWKKETRDRLAASLVGLWRRHLGFSLGYISDVADVIGRKGRSDADIALFRNIRLGYLKRASAVRAENIQVFNSVMSELINVCEADPVDSAARDLAVTNAANAFQAGSSGTKRTKKAQSRMLGKLAHQYKLDFDGDVVSLLSNELRITPVMPQSYAILQKLYRGIFINTPPEELADEDDPFSIANTDVIFNRLEKNEASFSLLQRMLAKECGNSEELLAKMKAEYESLRDLAVANFEHDLSTLQNVYRNALSKEELEDGDPFSLEYFSVVEKRLKEDPKSSTLLKEQLTKVGGNQEELLAKMKERFDILSANGSAAAASNPSFLQSNKYISHTSEGDVVDRILQYHFRGDQVLDTTISTNVQVKGKTWDAYKRLVETPNPLNTSQTMGDLLGLSDVNEENLCHAIKCRAGLKLNGAGKPHVLADKPFHLLTVTVSEPGKYFVKDLGFKKGALQVWADAVQVRNNNQSDSIFDLIAEPASFDMDVDELREKYIGKVADHWNRSGDKAFSTAHKVHLLDTLNVLTNCVREDIVSTSRDNNYQRPTHNHTVELITKTLENDTNLPHTGITSIGAGSYGSLPKVITKGMNRNDKIKLNATVHTAGKPFQIAVYPKSSHDLVKAEITAICIVLNKTVGFDKIEDKTIKQDAIVEICK